MKTKTIIINIIFLSLFCFKAKAQIIKIADKIFVAGYVYEEKTKQALAYVNIYVKKTRRGTITDTNGYFILKTEINDTLVFSSLGFDKKYVFINQEVVESNKALIIFLDTKIYELQNVDIYALRKYKQLEYEIVNMKLPDNDFTNATKNFPLRPVDIDYHNLNASPISGLGVVISPITALYQAFSKEGKEIQKLNKLQKQEKLENLLEQKLGIETIMKIIDENKENTIQFIEWCDFSEDFLLNISNYDLAIVIKHKFKLYRNNK